MNLKSGILFCVAVVLSSQVAAQKTVLITGGLSGIGKEITTTFRDDGWEVWTTSRTPEKHPPIEGVKVRKLDVTDSKAISALYKEIKSKSGKLDLLVNNAAFIVVGPTETLSVEQARQVMATNVIGPLQMMQEALPLMRANQGGKILNISSTAALSPIPGMGLYSASKMALEGMSTALAAEAAQWNIWVSVIEPGAVKGEAAAHATLPAKLNEFPGYVTFTNQLQRTLTSATKDYGQPPQQVANLVLSTAKTPQPNLRYQTSEEATELAVNTLVDPTGNTSRDAAISFARELYDRKS